MKVVSVAEMRQLERATFATGVTADDLQRRAGLAVARTVEARLPKGRLVALVGPGNNGRDSWIAAQRLLEIGWEAVLWLSPNHAISEPELQAFAAARGEFDIGEKGSVASRMLDGADLAIDGLLGIGGHGVPRGPVASMVEALIGWKAEHRDREIVSVDVPSGLDADTGQADGIAVSADCTVVLGGAKKGLLTPEASRFTGDLIFADLDLAEGIPDAAEIVTLRSLLGLLPARPPDAHKGTFGRLLVVAGSERYVGAAYLTCAAAVRAGAGLVTLAAPNWLRNVVAAQLPEVTFLPLPDGGPADHPEECLVRVSDSLERYDALAIGPGLSSQAGVPVFVEGVLRAAAQRGLCVVADADAINALADRPDWPTWIPAQLVMTPHLGELARLSGPTLGEAPWDLAQRLATNWGVTLVVKGPFTGIGSRAGSWVHARPNPALATAGTGDVLTGVVGGLLARGLSPSESARMGVWSHGEAGARAAAGFLGGGLAASDLLSEIPHALAKLAAAPYDPR
ncbi:MAG: NAD(P)H-hydrate dehydratase [Chloroflexi bacterium]|nr:NAD(P)H-hydrate dehydratase [Chloroflexota bacterium]